MIDLIDGAYLATSVIAAFASLSASSRGNAGWWLLLSLSIAAIGLLRIADAALWVDDHLRGSLMLVGWYKYRRILQIAAIAAFGLVLIAVLRRIPAPSGRTLTVAVAGFYLLALTMAIRSSSLHWADALFHHRVGPLNFSQASQALLLLVISIAVFFDLWPRLTRHQKGFE